VGVPARVVRLKGKKVEQPLDHVHIPDPVAQELCKLQVELRRLRERMDQMEKDMLKQDVQDVTEKEENNHETV